MNAVLRMLAAAGLLAAGFGHLHAQPPDMEMDNYVVALLHAPAGRTALTGTLAAAQEESLRRLDRTGLLVAAGPVRGDDSLRAMLVLRTDSVQRARELVESLPAVKSGAYGVALHPWFSAKALGRRRSEILRRSPDTTLAATAMQLVFLTRGASWTPERTPAVEKIQEGHMANINRLAGEGKLVIAGPFTDGGALRGIFVFRTSGLEEAAALTATDPAVVAGRLAVTLYEWSIPEAVIP